MSTSTEDKTISEARVVSRVLQEGFGPGAWHGPDLKAALADVTQALAFWRPASGRHNIAEIALHHAYFIRTVRVQLTGVPAEPSSWKEKIGSTRAMHGSHGRRLTRPSNWSSSDCVRRSRISKPGGSDHR